MAGADLSSIRRSGASAGNTWLMEGGDNHQSFYVLPPEEERLRHRLSVISEVSEESSPASSPLPSPRRKASLPDPSSKPSLQHDLVSEELR